MCAGILAVVQDCDVLNNSQLERNLQFDPFWFGSTMKQTKRVRSIFTTKNFGFLFLWGFVGFCGVLLVFVGFC